MYLKENNNNIQNVIIAALPQSFLVGISIGFVIGALFVHKIMKSKTVQKQASTLEQSDSPVYQTVELREQTETVSMSYNVAYSNVN